MIQPKTIEEARAYRYGICAGNPKYLINESGCLVSVATKMAKE